VGERWERCLGGLLVFRRSSGSDGRGVIEGVLNFMELGCGGRVCVAWFDGAFVWEGAAPMWLTCLAGNGTEMILLFSFAFLWIELSCDAFAVS
jgi:hypothetical protein